MLKPITLQNQTYLTPNWTQMGELSVTLAKRIIDGSDITYDRVLALAKGGYPWSRQLQDLLAIPELSTIQISFYKDIGETHASPAVIQSLPINIKGENILIYDDVVDSGETLMLAKDYLKHHGPKTIHTAAHFQKPQTKLHPDYYAFETGAWIIFPHEARETYQLLKKQWENVSDEEFTKELKKLHLEPALESFLLEL